MNGKEIAVRILSVIEDEGLQKFEGLKKCFDDFMDFLIDTVKADISMIESEEQLEGVVKEIIEIKITNGMIDELIRLPKTLEWADDIAIKSARPIVINFLVSFVKKNIVIRYGGGDWFSKFKTSVGNINHE